MEGSKTFSKDFMSRHNIPTARYQNFNKYKEAARYLDSVNHDVVIKASGLAAGKGVIIPTSKGEAHQALKEIMLDRQFGDAGDEVVIEEYLEGDELSVLTFSDGYTIKSLPPAQDHKRVFDDDKGPNTGGMGCYAPTRVAPKEVIAEIDRNIVQPSIDGMRKEGTNLELRRIFFYSYLNLRLSIRGYALYWFDDDKVGTESIGVQRTRWRSRNTDASTTPKLGFRPSRDHGCLYGALAGWSGSQD